MNKNITIIALIFIIFSVKINAQITENKLLTAAENFIQKTSILQNYKPKTDILKLFSENKIVAYRVNLEPDGYIVFTASENLYPVFSFSEKGHLNYNDIQKNPVFKSFLNNLKKQSEFAEIHKNKFAEVINRNKKKRKELFEQKNNSKNTKTFDYQFGYYLPDVWGGVNCWDNEGNVVYPSNYFTPNHFSPGCVAISAAQILHYYEWPPVGTGSHTDNDNTGNSQGTYYARFGSMFYDWKNMLNNYQGEYSTDTEQRAIGRLMYHVAVSVDMDFENDGSTSNTDKVPNAFQSYFRTTGHFEVPSWTEFRNRLQENLENKMPVQFGIEADNGEQHACVCDGYRYNQGDSENDKFYHLNMGWWNWYGGNAWYRIFDTFSAVGYTIITGGVFDIIPKPMMNSVVRTSDRHTFIVNWHVSKKLNWEAFQLQESFNNGTWTTISDNISDTLFQRTVTQDGIYKYRVKAKVGGNFFADSYSNTGVVQVGKTIFLDFDGNDSFFVNDAYDKLDLTDKWTYEAWVKVNSYSDNSWSVIADRKTVFSLYLINDADADFAVRFVARDNSGNIIASLRSDNSQINLQLGKWYHLAVSRDGTTARLFINGNLIQESTDANFVLSPSSNALNIGARYWGSYSRYFDGQIDEIRISDTARYADEFCPNRFKVLKNDKNTRLLLNLQFGTGTTLFDASRNFLGIALRNSPNSANWQIEQTPLINNQPRSMALCSGSTEFEINADYADSYRWQINTGNGFYNLTDDANISGSTSPYLSFNDVTPFAGNNLIRCILSNTLVPQTCSDNASFNVFANCTVWDGTAWSNGIPDETKSAVIDANYTADNFITTDNLIINQNDTLFVNENYTLNTQGNFLNNGVLFLKSENPESVPGTFICSGNIVNYGEMTAQKSFSAVYSDIEKNNFLIASPLNEKKEISDIFQTQQPNIYKNNGKIDSWTLLNQNDKFENNTAYLCQFNNDNTALFNGEFNNEEISEYLRKIGNDDFFALIPNTFSSYVNWNSANGWIKENIDEALYTYDLYNNGNSFNYSVWDGYVGIHSGNGYIKPNESFFVKMTDFRSSLQFDKTTRISAENIENNQNLPDNLIRFRFETENGDMYDEAVLYFSDTKHDCTKILPVSENKFYTFFLSGVKKYAIKRLENTNLDTIVPVGFKTSQSGQIKFKVTDFTFDDAVPVMLKDAWTGNYKILKKDSVYTFSASSSEPDNRFKLLFGNYASNINTVNLLKIKAWTDGKTIYIKNNSNTEIQFSLYNIVGQLLNEGKSTDTEIIIKNIPKGINILKIKNFKTYKFSITD